MLNQAAIHPVRTIDQRIIALCEVLLVFITTFALIWLGKMLPLGKIPEMFLSYTLMMGFPLLVLLAAHRDLNAYGLCFQRLADQLNLALAIFPVFAVEGAVSGWLLPMFLPDAVIRREGAMILSLLSVGFFLWTAWILRSKRAAALIFPACLGALPLVGAHTGLSEHLVIFLFYVLFLGPGEEILFRGYIQSRLNAAFGRPFHFWGVSWGWGLVIAALFFGLMHALNPFNPFQGKYNLYPWWGVWTIFGSLGLGYVREKAGSILPSALMHGLPQAIASLFLGVFAIR